MKILVDEMPYFYCECPFYKDDGSEECKLDGYDCEHINDHECRWLKAKVEVPPNENL